MDTKIFNCVGPYCQFHEFSNIVDKLHSIFAREKRYRCVNISLEFARLDVNKAAIYRYIPKNNYYGADLNRFRSISTQNHRESGCSTKEMDRAFLDEEARKFDEQFKRVIEGLQVVSTMLMEWDSALQEEPEKLYEFVLDEEMKAGYGMSGNIESPYKTPAENDPGNRVDMMLKMINNTHNDDKEIREDWDRILDQARFAQSALYAICTIVGDMRDIDYLFRAKASTLSGEVRKHHLVYH